MTVGTIETFATLDDLYEIDGKAELRDGELVIMPPTGDDPGLPGTRSLFRCALTPGKQARAERLVTIKGSSSICPIKGRSARMPPILSESVLECVSCKEHRCLPWKLRSENDYGPQAKRDMAEKRRDYFTVGTLVVWDVNLQSDTVVWKYRAESPGTPEVFQRGEIANAEPAVPGWSMPVDDLFL